MKLFGFQRNLITFRLNGVSKEKKMSASDVPYGYSVISEKEKLERLFTKMYALFLKGNERVGEDLKELFTFLEGFTVVDTIFPVDFAQRRWWFCVTLNVGEGNGKTMKIFFDYPEARVREVRVFQRGGVTTEEVKALILKLGLRLKLGF